MPTPILFEHRIRAAAFHYAVMEVRDANALAELVGVSARSLYRVTEPSHRLHSVWRGALTEMGFEGEVSGFRVRPRGRGMDKELFEEVRRAWREIGSERRRGYSRRQIGIRFVDEFGISLPTALSWLRKYEKAEMADD